MLGKAQLHVLLAERLGFQFLDTGAMYRAVTLAAIHQGVDLHDEPALQTIATEIEIVFDGEEVFIDGKKLHRGDPRAGSDSERRFSGKCSLGSFLFS